MIRLSGVAISRKLYRFFPATHWCGRVKNTLLAMLGVVALMLNAYLPSGQLVAAEQLSEMDAYTAQAYALHLTEKFAEQKDQPLKVEVDADLALGLALDNEGLILVPAEGLKEGEVDEAVHTEVGSGLAWLFMSPRFNPMLKDKKISQDQLMSVKFTDESGDEKVATCLLLGVRNVSGDDWRLYAYGKDKKPLIDAKFEMAEEESEDPVSMTVKEANEKGAKLVITLFGKYSADFQIGQ